MGFNKSKKNDFKLKKAPAKARVKEVGSMKLNKELVQSLRESLLKQNPKMEDGKRLVNISGDWVYRVMLCDIYEMLCDLCDEKRNDGNDNGNACDD